VRTNLNELQSFAFCPVFHRTEGGLPSSLSPIIITLKNLIIYLYSRQLELGHKISWEEAQNIWNRSWWSIHDLDDRQARKDSNAVLLVFNDIYQYYLADTRQVIAVNLPYLLHLQDHVVCGEIPLVLCESSRCQEISLVDIRQTISVNELTRDLSLRAASLMVEQNIGVRPTIIEVLCFGRALNLSHTCLYPTAAFQEKSRLMVSSLLQAVHKELLYPNKHACPTCTLQGSCMV